MGYSKNRPIIQIDNKELSSQLAENAQKLPLYTPKVIEAAGTTHAGGGTYTAFFSGAVIKGKEIYVARSGADHFTSSGNGWAKIVAYIRGNDGEFTSKVLNLDYSSREYRDPHLTLNQSGSNLVLSATGFDGATYTNWAWGIDYNLNLTATTELVGTGGYFCWGNFIYSPQVKGLKCAYIQTADLGGVVLFRQGTPWTKTEIFPPSSSKPTEATIAYWGNKLVCIARQNSGNMLYRETFDLEGVTGWGDIITLPFKGDAPCLEPLIPESEPLLLTASVGSTKRDINIIGTYDGSNWSQLTSIAINSGNGGYNSFVRNNFGYGIMYFDEIDSTTTSVNFIDVQVEKYLPELKALELVNDRKPTDWISLTLQNGWTETADNLPTTAPPFGGRINSDGSLEVRGQIEGGVRTNRTLISVVPEPLVPRLFSFSVCSDGTGNLFAVHIKNNGELYIYAANTASSLFINAVF